MRGINDIIKHLANNEVPPTYLIESIFGKSNKTLNKDDLVKEVAQKIRFSQKDVQTVVDALVDTINLVMSNGDKALISGLGRFEMKKLAQRDIMHPRSGERLTLPARHKPAFKPQPHLGTGHLAYGRQSEAIDDEIYQKLNNVRDFLADDAGWIRAIASELTTRLTAISPNAKAADKFDQEFARMLWRLGYGDPKQSSVPPSVIIDGINKLLKKYGQSPLTTVKGTKNE